MPEQLIEAYDDLADNSYQVPATPPQREGSKPQNSDAQSVQCSTDSSTLSSLPSTIGSTPKGLLNHIKTRPFEQVGATRAGSPVRRSKRDRKATNRFDRDDGRRSTSPPTKRRKITLSPETDQSGSSTAVPSPETLQRKGLSSSSLADDNINPQGSDLLASLSRRSQKGLRSSSNTSEVQVAIVESNSRSEPLLFDHGAKHAPKYPRVKDDERLELDIANAFLAKSQDRPYQSQYKQDQIEKYVRRFPTVTAPHAGLDHEGWKCDERYPGFDRRNPTYYHADGITKTASSNTGQPGSNQDSEAPSPSTKNNKASNLGKAGKNHGRSSKANKGRTGGGGGGGRDRDSPEPPNKIAMSQEDKKLLAHIRARQAELRRFYATVVAQQKQALEVMASKDLTRLLKKPKVHTKIAEYEEIIEQLQRKEQDTQDVIQTEYEMQIALADEWRKAQEEVINSQWHKRVTAAKEEHAKGAQGDLIIFHKAHRAAGDETKTDNGSDIECYFPRYHELPEPDTGPRGYNSSRVDDEKSFKEHLASYDDQAQRDIIEDDIVGPVVQSVAEQNAQRQAEEERKARFNSLVSVAEDELKRPPGYLIPRPLYPSENPQFALSRLADCAEYISRAHASKAYVFMPIAPRDLQDFPHHHLERVPPPNVSEAVPPTSTAQSQISTPRKSISRRNKSLSVPAKHLSRDDEPQSQSSSNTSTPFAALAPAPSRMPPPSMASQHHHHLLHPQQVPPAPANRLPPPPPPPPPPAPPSAVASRSPALTPLITSRRSLPHTSPPTTPTTGQTPTMPTQGPPPPQPPPPGLFHPGPILAQYGPPLPHLGHYPPPGPYQPRPAFSPPVQHPPRTERPPQSPIESTTPTDQPQHRFSISTSTQGPPKPRLGGPRRAPGEITFTNVQTPKSERFRSPSHPPANLPGQSVLRPGAAPNAPNGLGTGKIANTFVDAAPDANSRSAQAAVAARQNAMVNAGQGAGPKGGRRVLLPKGQKQY